MEILKEGNAKRIKKCWRCRTKFVYDLLKDTRGIFNDYVRCPVCGKDIYFIMFDRKYKK